MTAWASVHQRGLAPVRGVAVRGVIGRAVVSAAAVMGLLGVPVGAASAGAGPAVLAFERSQYAYGLVSIGVRPERVLTLVNTGGRASGSLTVSVSGSPAFTVAADTCTGSSLGPRKSCTVTVRFAPRAVGPFLATLVAVGKNRAASASVALSGAGRGLGAGSDEIYWTIDDGTINAGTLAGEWTAILVTPLSHPNQNMPNQLVVDGDYLYWADTGLGTINVVPLYGGDDNVVTLFSGQNQPAGIAVSGDSIYWTNTGDGTINAGPLAGGNTYAYTLVSNQNAPMGLALDGTSLYWANYGDGTINAAPLAGGSSYVLVGGQAQPYGVAVDGSSIYWTTWNWVAGGLAGSGGVYQAPLSGEFANLLVGGLLLPAGLTVDSTSVYWASYGDNAIMQAPLAGGTSRVLIDVSGAPAPPRGVALSPQWFQ